MCNFALIISLVHMSTRCVNHGALNVWRGQTVKVCICVESCEVLEEGLEVLVGVVNVLQVSNIVTICTHHMCKQNGCGDTDFAVYTYSFGRTASVFVQHLSLAIQGKTVNSSHVASQDTSEGHTHVKCCKD